MQKKELNHHLQSIDEYKQMTQDIFKDNEPPFNHIVHIQLRNTDNINQYLKDQSILAVTFDLYTDKINK